MYFSVPKSETRRNRIKWMKMLSMQKSFAFLKQKSGRDQINVKNCKNVWELWSPFYKKDIWQSIGVTFDRKYSKDSSQILFPTVLISLYSRNVSESIRLISDSCRATWQNSLFAHAHSRFPADRVHPWHKWHDRDRDRDRDRVNIELPCLQTLNLPLTPYGRLVE